MAPNPPVVVTGIDGYRPFNNEQHQPYFSAELPSNWQFAEHKLEAQEGHWFSLRGPTNASLTRFTALDIYVITKGTEAKYENLEGYVDHSILQESVGQSNVVFNRPVNLDGMEGREVRISSDRAFPRPSGVVKLSLIKQWLTIFIGDHILQIFYESPQEDFDTYFVVYEHLLETLSVQQE